MPLQPAHIGPFTVLDKDKCFILNLGDRTDSVSIDRLKAAHMFMPQHLNCQGDCEEHNESPAPAISLPSPLTSTILYTLTKSRNQTSYPPSAHSISPYSAPSSPSLALGRPSTPPLLSLTLSGLFNGMMEVSVPGALNYFTFSHPIQSTFSASRNPISTPLPLSGFLDSLFCVLIALTPGLAFSLLMPRTPAAALSFSSGRVYPFLNFLPPLCLCSIPTLIM